jgi:hypothetical protein
MRTVESAEAEDTVTMRDPSGLKAAENTNPSCPGNAATTFIVEVSQIYVPSDDAVTSCGLSGL